jgi:hypothetical protein
MYELILKDDYLVLRDTASSGLFIYKKEELVDTNYSGKILFSVNNKEIYHKLNKLVNSNLEAYDRDDLVTLLNDWKNTPSAAGSSTVSVSNFPATQPVSGSVSVGNFPATQPVSGSVSVGNFPATQAISGSVSVGNFPATQAVSGSVSVGNFPATQAVSGSVSVGNFPATQAVTGTFYQATQPVSGSVSVGNFPATQPVSGSVSVGNFPATQQIINNDKTTATYLAVSNNFLPATNPTDIFTITGSATKIIKIRRIFFAGVKSASAIVDVLLVKRSTANTGGTSTAIPIVPNDSTNSAATAVVRNYTANPTLGTTLGFVDNKKYFINGGISDISNQLFEFNGTLKQPIVLRGIGEVLAVNLNATATTMAGGNWLIGVEFTEE